jgi:hypothetical protein
MCQGISESQALNIVVLEKMDTTSTLYWSMANQASPVILLRTNEVVDLQIFQDLLSASYLSLKW